MKQGVFGVAGRLTLTPSDVSQLLPPSRERSSRRGFPEEPFHLPGSRGGAGRKYLEGDGTVEGELDGLVDYPHPPAPDLPDDLKIAQAPAL